MSCRLRIREAVPADEPALRALSEQGMDGVVRLAFPQTPDFFAAEAVRGEARLGVLTDDSGEVLGCGARVVRRAWFDGAWRRTGYYCTLRAGDRGRNARAVSLAYSWAREVERRDPLPVITSAVLSGNTRALRLLTSRRFSLPAYLDAGEIVTLTASAHALRRFGTMSQRVELLTGVDVGEAALRAFYAAGTDLPPLFPELPAPFPPGLGLGDFVVLRRNGRIVAAAALWNQRAFRQVQVLGYAPWLRLLRPAVNLVCRGLGLVRLPKPGSPLAVRYLAFRRIAGDAPDMLAHLLGVVGRRLGPDEGLVFSVHANDPLLACLDGLRAIRTSSRLFTLSYDEAPVPPVFGSAPYVEAAML